MVANPWMFRLADQAASAKVSSAPCVREDGT